MKNSNETKNADLELIKLDYVERKRKYYFASSQVEITNVTHFLCRPSGTHRLMTADGRKWIVNPGWLCIELEVEDWTV